MTAHIELTASTYGIAQAAFSNLDISTLQTGKDAIIHDLKALLDRGRALLQHSSYTPQRLPIMWFVGLDEIEAFDFGLMLDVVACTDELIDQRADEIIQKLCRDCMLIQNIKGSAFLYGG